MPKKLNKSTEVIITLPDQVEIELVQANSFRHYELFQWLVAFLGPIAVGFWTAYFVGQKSGSLWWSALSFSIIAALFLILAVRKRRQVFNNSIRKRANLDDFKIKDIEGGEKQ